MDKGEDIQSTGAVELENESGIAHKLVGSAN